MKKIVPIVATLAIISGIVGVSFLVNYSESDRGPEIKLVEPSVYICVDISAPNNEGSLFVGQTLQLSAVVTQSGTTTGINQSVVWSSSDVAIASINQTGFINTHNTGTVTFTASAVTQDPLAPDDVGIDTYTLVVYQSSSAGQFAYMNTDVLPDGSTTPGIGITGFDDPSLMFNPILTIPSAIDGKPVYEIRPFAFNNKDYIREVRLPDSVIAVQQNAFANCDSLEIVHIPASLSIYDPSFLQLNPCLKEITVAAGNSALKVVDGVLFNNLGTELLFYPAASKQTTYNIPNQVTTINEAAFANARNLTSIYIPDSVTTIGDQAFFKNTALESIRFSPNATILSADMLAYAESLRNVSIPEGVEIINARTFGYCPLLEVVFLPDSLTAILNEAFIGCTGLGWIDLPGRIQVIGDRSFKDCTSLTTIELAGTIVALGNNAFENCQSLAVVNCSSLAFDSDSWIGEGIFAHCDSLSAINVATSTNPFKSIDGVLYYDTILLFYPAAKTGSAYTIPNGTTKVRFSSFGGAKNLETLTIPASVNEIIMSDISGSTRLQAINVDLANETYASINGVLFGDEMSDLLAYPAGKTDLTYTVPEAIKTLGNYAFNGNPYLQTLNINDGLFEILDNTLQGLSNLTNLNIPNTILTNIGENSIIDNPKLSSLTLPNGLSELGSNSLVRNNALETINMGVSSNAHFQVKDRVLFEHTDDGKEVLRVYPARRGLSNNYEVPDETTDIAPYAFYATQYLVSLQLPSEVVTLPDYAIANNISLREIIINDKLKSISPTATIGNAVLETYAEVNDNPIYDVINGVLFSTDSASGLRTLVSYPVKKSDANYTVPDGVHVINSYAFYNGLNLRTIDLPYSLSTISDYAFAGCLYLRYMVIPRFVGLVMSNAFTGIQRPLFLEAEEIPGGWALDFNPSAVPVYTADQWYYADSIPNVRGQ